MKARFQGKSIASWVLLAASLGVALALALFISFSKIGAKQQVADVFVLMQPFTNAVLKSDFERRMKLAAPGIAELHFQKTDSVRYGPNQQCATNTQVVIQIAATGEAAETAIANANEIAPRVCAAITQLFPDASVTVLNPAVGTREATSYRWLGLRLGQRREFEPAPVSDAVAFVGTVLLLSPGEEWQQHYTAGMPCPPALLGVRSREGQFLSASLCNPGLDSFEAAVTTIVESLRARGPSQMPGRSSQIDSLQTDSFTTEAGLFGVRISYYQNDTTSGRVLRSRLCEYITTNAAGRFVRITHCALASGQTNEVQERIFQSLRLK